MVGATSSEGFSISNKFLFSITVPVDGNIRNTRKQIKYTSAVVTTDDNNKSQQFISQQILTVSNLHNEVILCPLNHFAG